MGIYKKNIYEDQVSYGYKRTKYTITHTLILTHITYDTRIHLHRHAST